MLVAHCTALEAHGPIASLNAGSAGSCGTPIGPRRASINSSDPAATGFRTDHLSKKAVGTTMVVQ